MLLRLELLTTTGVLLRLELLTTTGVLLRLELLTTTGVLLRLLLGAGVLLVVPPAGATARPVAGSIRPGQRRLLRRVVAIWAIALLVLV